MSNPQNILGKFDTYAYHHILMVCNSTDTAEALSKTDEITTFQHPRNQVRYSARDVAGIKDGKYVTLIDGTSDARFYITSARWSNVIAAEPHIGKGNIPQSTTMSTDGELEIVEPMGASFLNRLTDICDELDTDPVGLIFLLKTIFVGHSANGNSEMISSVRPMMFVAFDISAIFDSSGSKYKMEFVGLTNGAGKLRQTQRIFEGLSFKMGNTLGETFGLIEKAVNDSYETFKLQAIRDFATTLEDVEENAAIEQATAFVMANYRDVKYKILTRDYTDEKYKAGDIENIRIKDGIAGTTVNYGGAVGIEEILNRVMASSGAVIDDAKKKGDAKKLNGPDAKYIYKIVSTLRSSPTEYTVEYHVNKYLQVVSPYTQQEKDGNIVPLPGQSIEFNYIFTGKNVDIKNFDIKMEMGMAFFQIAATTDNIPTQKSTIDGDSSSAVQTTGSSVVAGTGMKKRGKSPLFLGTTLSQPMSRNTTRPIDSAGFQALLERHASLENVAASMTIYGNPQLLDEMTILPSEVGLGQTEKPVEGATINPRWMSTPTLIKVNIRMPVDANDVNTEYEAFWYTGYYTLITVDNVFEEGTFTQELGMFSIPITAATDDVSDATIPTEPEEKSIFTSIVASAKSLFTGNGADGEKQTKDIRWRQWQQAQKTTSNQFGKKED